MWSVQRMRLVGHHRVKGVAGPSFAIRGTANSSSTAVSGISAESGIGTFSLFLEQFCTIDAPVVRAQYPTDHRRNFFSARCGHH
jgi:hypothetical protein